MYFYINVVAVVILKKKTSTSSSSISNYSGERHDIQSLRVYDSDEADNNSEETYSKPEFIVSSNKSPSPSKGYLLKSKQRVNESRKKTVNALKSISSSKNKRRLTEPIDTNALAPVSTLARGESTSDLNFTLVVDDFMGKNKAVDADATLIRDITKEINDDKALESEPENNTRTVTDFYNKENYQRFQDMYGKFIKATSRNGRRMYQCKQCQKSFSTRRMSKKHLEEHEGSSIKPYACVRCEKSFFVLDYLVSHFEVVHQNRKKKFQCFRLKIPQTPSIPLSLNRLQFET